MQSTSTMLRMLMPANKPSVPPMASSLPEKLIVSSLLDLMAELLGVSIDTILKSYRQKRPINSLSNKKHPVHLWFFTLICFHSSSVTNHILMTTQFFINQLPIASTLFLLFSFKV